eukprot:350579-Chlamydomonas_euryale.AAC.2
MATLRPLSNTQLVYGHLRPAACSSPVDVAPTVAPALLLGKPASQVASCTCARPSEPGEVLTNSRAFEIRCGELPPQPQAVPSVLLVTHSPSGTTAFLMLPSSTRSAIASRRPPRPRLVANACLVNALHTSRGCRGGGFKSNGTRATDPT